MRFADNQEMANPAIVECPTPSIASKWLAQQSCSVDSKPHWETTICDGPMQKKEIQIGFRKHR